MCFFNEMYRQNDIVLSYHDFPDKAEVSSWYHMSLVISAAIAAGSRGMLEVSSL